MTNRSVEVAYYPTAKVNDLRWGIYGILGISQVARPNLALFSTDWPAERARGAKRPVAARQV